MPQATPDEKSARHGADPRETQDIGIIHPTPTVTLLQDVFERGQCNCQQAKTENVEMTQKRRIRIVHAPQYWNGGGDNDAGNHVYEKEPVP
jgi:hypothetical protein